MTRKQYTIGILLLVSVFFLNGCAVIFQKGRRSDQERIQTLEDELARLKNTKSLLEERLAKELADEQVKVSMEDKGLVITFVAEVLFDSGKATLRKESLPILDKVARILREEASRNNIGIEGHTDNEPIKYSGWKSNWELSSHRALSVLYYLESQGINPERLSATGFGEYKPVTSNDTIEGKQMNRRVEIVIIPESAQKVQGQSSGAAADEGYKEELK